MAKSEFALAFNEITETHHLPRQTVIDALQQALISAYRRDSGASPAQRVDAEVDLTTNHHKIMVEMEVVDSVMNEHTEVSLEKALYHFPTAQLGDMVMIPIEYNVKTFGRIAAQTAKQVILQKIREAERKSLYEEYKDREGDLITGQVQSITGQHITLSLGRAEAIMPRNQQIQGERYRAHDKVRTYVLEVKESSRGPQIVVSRAHKNMLRRLLEYEVPEIYNGQVEIKNIAREPGHRSKVAVAALQPGVDPVGACVGMRGMRIQNIVKELSEEKIDVIEWNPDQAIFIAKALSPARVTAVYLEDDIDQGHTATVIVPDDQLSLAIGREGQNARLAAKLTGWRIDIKSVSEAAVTSYNSLNEPPLDALLAEHTDLVAEVARILTKKKAERAVMPEEYQTLSRFVQIVEQRQLAQREAGRARRLKAMEKVRPNIPPAAFEMKLEELELAADITQALKHIENVGELMVRLQAEEDNLHKTLELGGADVDAMDAIREAIASLVLTRPAAPEANVESVEKLAEAPITPEARIEALGEAAPVSELAPEAIAAAPETAAVEDEEVPPAFVDEEQQPEVVAPAPARRPAKPAAPRPAAPVFEPFEATEAQTDAAKKGKKEKKGKGRGRELVFDERRGEVVAKRKRKGHRSRDWGAGEFEDEV
ncbi:MAG TPA: transcription termination factor NusA [Aggregatilineales bacterium]|nr:transcription termination factor NusA [Aggregatilineales bacterium]